MPNAQGGFTYEEEQEFIARRMAAANFQPSPEVNPTPEQQAQQVANNMAAAIHSTMPTIEPTPEQQGILDVMGPMVYGLGPPYTASSRPYSGPPPMEPGPDLNYDFGFPSNWYDYSSNNTTTGGGFFTIEDLFHSQGKAVPQVFQAGAGGPSTNNYRLLPPGYRERRYIMRNGTLIDMKGQSMYGPNGLGSTMDGASPHWRQGNNTPVAHAYFSGSSSYGGWPGQLGGFSLLGTPTT